MPEILSRQMHCGHCAHEHLWLGCDWCECIAHDQPGIYPDLAQTTDTTGGLP